MLCLRIFLLALALAVHGPQVMADPVQVPDEPIPVNASKTYTIRIEAYDTGTLVYSQEHTITVSSELEFRITVGNLQSAASRLLNSQNKRWNRITFVLVRSH
jgi:hypothetical protein